MRLELSAENLILIIYSLSPARARSADEVKEFTWSGQIRALLVELNSLHYLVQDQQLRHSTNASAIYVASQHTRSATNSLRT